MPSLAEYQATWRDALLTQDRDDSEFAAVSPALAIHKNNFLFATREALASVFGTVSALVGEEFFAAMAKAFIIAEPPTSPVILDYGSGFPGFIANFPPAGTLPYLSDIAVFEWDLHQVALAADAQALEPSFFSAQAVETLLSLELALIPGARIFQSKFAVVDIWRAHKSVPVDLTSLGPIDVASRALMVRNDGLLSVISLTKGEKFFLDALNNGEDLGTATAIALDGDPAYDILESNRKLAATRCFQLRE
ncbi:DNA-binding domain-containing protein [Pelagibius sp. Alg239-R121]|uniref:HvfC/BufC N-terminal domain-containing protein n=1 Tax=Pelagibius sp. Alg239-R121 TaxID=2993448 RepID=UPI0024A68B59|nr:DNA-binding domain-containing protein [Pelagibius sp. Alg239-R121]